MPENKNEKEQDQGQAQKHTPSGRHPSLTVDTKNLTTTKSTKNILDAIDASPLNLTSPNAASASNAPSLSRSVSTPRPTTARGTPIKRVEPLDKIEETKILIPVGSHRLEEKDSKDNEAINKDLRLKKANQAFQEAPFKDQERSIIPINSLANNYDEIIKIIDGTKKLIETSLGENFKSLSSDDKKKYLQENPLAVFPFLDFNAGFSGQNLSVLHAFSYLALELQEKDILCKRVTTSQEYNDCIKEGIIPIAVISAGAGGDIQNKNDVSTLAEYTMPRKYDKNWRENFTAIADAKNTDAFQRENFEGLAADNISVILKKILPQQKTPKSASSDLSPMSPSSSQAVTPIDDPGIKKNRP